MDEESWYESEQNFDRQPPTPTPRRALRLTFEYDGESVELVGMEQLEKLVPPMIGEAPEDGRHSGDWLQVRDSDDRPLFTRLLHDPLRIRVEVHDPDAGPHIVVGPPGRGTFDVLVPDLPNAAYAVLFASPAPGKDQARALRPAEPIGRYDLRHADGDTGTAS